jgi:ankyrin repeat protein
MNVWHKLSGFLFLSILFLSHKDITMFDSPVFAASESIGDETVNEQLIRAVMSKDYPEVEKLLTLKANPNAVDEYGNSALILATQVGSLDMVQLLLSKGADINAVDDQLGAPALHLAISNDFKYYDIALFLIEQPGININQTCELNGNTALMRLIKDRTFELSQRIQIAKMLLEKGTNIHIKNQDKQTALQLAVFYDEPQIAHLAIEIGELELLKPLLDKQKNINIRDEHGFSPLHHAILRNNLQIIELLIAKGADINSQDPHGYTPLILANTTDSANILLKHGANLHTKTTYGITALMSATLKGNAAMIELLAQHGANVKETTGPGFNILMLVPSAPSLFHEDGEPPYSPEKIIELLIKYGADIHAKTNDGANILVAFVVNYRNPHKDSDVHFKRILDFLISKGIDINAQDNYGNTALMYAAMGTNTSKIQSLLNAGAKWDIKNKEGQSALNLAITEKHKEIIKVLEDWIRDKNKSQQ